MMIGLNIEFMNIKTNTNLPSCGDVVIPLSDNANTNTNGKTDMLKHKLITVIVHIGLRWLILLEFVLHLV